MATKLRDFQQQVDDLIQEGSSIIKPDGRDRAIFMAQKRFSKDKPRVTKYDITATGTYSYSLPSTGVGNWIKGFSNLISVEFPADRQDPTFLDPVDYTIFEDDTSQTLRFPSSSPQSGTIRIEYTVPWFLDKDTSNIEDGDEYAFSCLAGSICMRYLAAYFAQTSKPSMDIDVIDYQRRVIEYTDLADSLENIYRDHLGIPRIGAKKSDAGGVAPPASVSKDLDIEFPWGENYITHPRRQR